MCVVVLSRVSTDDDEKNVSAVYSVSRRPFVVDLLANEDTETTAFRSLEEERETTGNLFDDCPNTTPRDRDVLELNETHKIEGPRDTEDNIIIVLTSFWWIDERALSTLTKTYRVYK